MKVKRAAILTLIYLVLLPVTLAPSRSNAVISSSSVGYSLPYEPFQTTFNITGSYTNLSNYLVQIVVVNSSFTGGAGNVLFAKGVGEASFGDVIFTDTSGNNLTYIMVQNSPGRYAEFWVKIPNLIANSSDNQFVLHWGNLTMDSASNVSAPLWWEDGTDRGAWNYDQGVTSASSSGIMTVSSEGQWAEAFTNETFGSGVAIEAVISEEATGAEYGSAFGFVEDEQRTNSVSINYGVSSALDTVEDQAESLSPLSFNLTAFHRVSLRWGSMSAEVAANTTNPYTLVANAATSIDIPQGDYHISIDLSNVTFEYDWLMVRPYVSPEPYVSSWGNTAGPTSLGGWTWTQLASVPQYQNSSEGSDSNKIVRWNDLLVFFRLTSPSTSEISVFNMTSGLLTDVFSPPPGQLIFDLQSVEGELVACYGFSIYPTYNGTFVASTDGYTWFTLFTENRVIPESFYYQGNNSFLIGGYRSDGRGTYGEIDSWNGTYSVLFRGTPLGSDDATFITWTGSQYVAGDAFPFSLFYSDDGVSWTDTYTGTNITAENPWGWAWSSQVAPDGSLWMPVQPYSTEVEESGMAEWNGNQMTFQPTPDTLHAIANWVVGGSEGLWSTASNDYPGDAVIYIYGPDGTLEQKVMEYPVDSMVQSIYYDSIHGLYYALVDDKLHDSIYLLEGLPSAPLVSQFKVTLSYAAYGIGSPNPPTLFGTQNGMPFSATLSTTPTTYLLDAFTTWSVRPGVLYPSNSTERWITREQTEGVVSGDTTVLLRYYQLFPPMTSPWFSPPWLKA
jgi:hypothetical protein